MTRAEYEKKSKEWRREILKLGNDMTKEDFGRIRDKARALVAELPDDDGFKHVAEMETQRLLQYVALGRGFV